jgi:hypothetical protein
VSERTSARTGLSWASSSRTSSEPRYPEAPVTRVGTGANPTVDGLLDEMLTGGRARSPAARRVSAGQP